MAQEQVKPYAKLALENNGGGFKRCVLNWNQSVIQVYESLAAKPQSDTTIYRLTGKELAMFAQSND